MFHYVGVDIGGGENTWALVLREERPKGEVILHREALSLAGPKRVSLSEIEQFCQTEKVLAVAIDAPLSFSPTLEKGFRKSDKTLRDLLPKDYKNWVLSYHGLMGIPIRAYLFAKRISPYCGTIIETHPRAGLFFILPEERRVLASKYKRGGLSTEELSWLVDHLRAKYDIVIPGDCSDLFFGKEGLIDALICALTAWAYHRFPERLIFLPQDEGLEGFGPFVVLEL